MWPGVVNNFPGTKVSTKPRGGRSPRVSCVCGIANLQGGGVREATETGRKHVFNVAAWYEGAVAD